MFREPLYYIVSIGMTSGAEIHLTHTPLPYAQCMQIKEGYVPTPQLVIKLKEAQ